MTSRRMLIGGLAATAALGGVAWRFGVDLGHARAGVRHRSRLLSLAGQSIEYADQGGGPVLLSIHGAGGGFDQGLANAAELVGDGYRIVAPSRFGYLRTPVPPDASPASQAEAHAALLEALSIPKAIVLGVSAGARSAVELALRRPERVAALILMVPGLYAPESPVSIEPSRGSRFAFWAVNAGGDFAWWAAMKMSPSILIRFLGVRPELVATASPAERRRVLDIVRSVEPLSQRYRGINVDSTPDLHELPLEQISAPTLIVSARDDLFNTLPAAQYAADRIPGARLAVYDTGGHLLVGRGAAVRAEVKAFVDSAGAGSVDRQSG
ncbi:alpha/beta fold hydrolase [Phenylobacterium sp.]|uniref:alpha/beta fold hydrolase n=1 Tax=Phenylobacterium sp. TaxID=1871053 RepID=UPI002FCB46E8